MCGPGLPLCLLWIIGATTQVSAKVAAPASLTAEAGRPVLLYCNITTRQGESVRQVRWLNNQSALLLAYSLSPSLRVSHRGANVELAAADHGSSSISIKKVGSDDGGCYRCIFDVFPTGMQESSTCVNITAKVHLEGNKTAVSGKPVSLSCSYSLSDRVHQVMWKKTPEQGDTTMVAWNTKANQGIREEFKGRVRLTRTLGESTLTLAKVRTEDEACYSCEFHTFPDGTRKATTCLSVYVLPKPEVTHVTTSSGITEANCTAQSRPPANIVWDAGSDNRTLGPPIISSYEQGDGTTIVTSTLLFQSAVTSGRSVRCIVQHQGLDKALTLSLQTDAMNPTTIILISVCGVAAVLLLCLCVCLCKCFICTDD
ncbi:OX-2 membrane glycoprotein-like [Cyprinodon tularosa]|uniref:OX-2 membrane glycoprotein-like n=1 Tax=Cyprinodon tularosa TaxID=77115 RepID=UPI0018E1F8E3|nr:OX-2 membrane glycoprotein-like [Cyprinodon tularosa]